MARRRKAELESEQQEPCSNYSHTPGDAPPIGVKKSRSLQLVSFDALPDWMKDNQFLLHYHRSPTHSFLQCGRSIFKLHTETMNIWTHILGSLAFVAIMLFWYVDFYSPVGRDILHFHASKLPWREQVFHLFFLLSAILCMGFSAIFHTVAAHSHEVAAVFSRLDYSGIAILITGSNVMCYYYGFYCNEFAHALYTWAIIICGSMCVVASMWSKFSEPGYHRIRAGLFVTLGLVAIFPLYHLWSVYGWTVIDRNMGMTSLIYMGASYLIGTLFYVLRIPERFFPGWCDILIHSHTIFHILVFIGCVMTYDSMHTMALTRYLKNLRGLTSCNTIILESS